MRRLFIAAMMLIPMMAMAEIPGMERLIRQYGDNESVTIVTIDGTTIQMMLGGDESLDGVASQFEGITVIMTEDEDIASDIHNRIGRMVRRAHMDTLCDIAEEETHVTIYTLSEGEVTTDIFVSIADDGETGCVAITGEFTAETISDIMSGSSNLINFSN